jgi:hypothetical protein
MKTVPDCLKAELKNSVLYFSSMIYLFFERMTDFVLSQLPGKKEK